MTTIRYVVRSLALCAVTVLVGCDASEHTVVREKLAAIANEVASARAYSPRESSELLRIRVPRRWQPSLQLFASHQGALPMWYSHWVLILYDPLTGATSPEPVIISDRWLGKEGVEPRIADLDGDGVYEIVYRDFRHNGTATNIEQKVFLEVGDDLSFTEILRLDFER